MLLYLCTWGQCNINEGVLWTNMCVCICVNTFGWKWFVLCCYVLDVSRADLSVGGGATNSPSPCPSHGHLILELFIRWHFCSSILQRILHSQLFLILSSCQEGKFEDARWPRRHCMKNRSLIVLVIASWYLRPSFFKEAVIQHRLPCSHLVKKPFLKKQDGQEGIVWRILHWRS